MPDSHIRKILLAIMLSAIVQLPQEAEAGYKYGLGFSPIIQSMRGTGGNYGFGYPYSPYAYSYGNPHAGGGSNGYGGFYGGAFGPNFNDFTMKNSAFGLGYGFPYYG